MKHRQIENKTNGVIVEKILQMENNGNLGKWSRCYHSPNGVIIKFVSPNRDIMK